VRRNLRSLVCLILILATFGFLLVLPANLRRVSQALVLADSSSRIDKAASLVKGSGFKKQQVRFEVNRGQIDARARFIARTAEGSLFLTPNEAVLCLPEIPIQPELTRPTAKTHRATSAKLPASIQTAVLRLRPLKCNARSRLIGVEKLPGVSNYFIGNDPKKWRTNVESYSKVKYENLYPGIDLIYYGNGAGAIEYDFIVAPGANPDLISMAVEGADEIDLDQPSGDLLLATSVGRVRQHAPRLFQEINGERKDIAGHYKLLDPVQPIQDPSHNIQQREVAFEVGDYDSTKPLVIDRVVVYSTLLGGAAGNFDGSRGVAVDAQGNAYITGSTESSDFPTRNAFDGTPPQRFGASSKAFITKFAPDGTLIYSTFLGGNDSSTGGSAIAVDATGNVYVAGSAGSGLPIVNAFQSSIGSASDAFITKFNSDGNVIIYSSYLGGNQGESVKDLKLDGQNNAYLLGEVPGRGVANVTFPTVNPTQANYGGGDRDVFLSIVAASGTNLLFSTFLGGDGDEEAAKISVPPTGSPIVVSGASNSTNLPAAGLPRQAGTPSCDELNSFLYVLFGGSGEGGGPDIQIILEFADYVQWLEDRHGVEPTCAEKLEFLYGIFGSGASQRSLQGANPTLPMGSVIASSAYPTPTSGLINSTLLTHQATGGGFEIVVASIDQNGKGTPRALFGGSRDEFVGASTTDSRGALYIAGDTTSTDLPTVSPTQATPGGATDGGFVVVFAPNTYDVLFATYLGGDGFTLPESIAVDAQGNIFVAGVVTIATSFPTTPGAFQRDVKGRNDAFLVKYSPVEVPTGPDFTLSFPNPTVTASIGKTKIPASINPTGGFSGNVTITPVNPPQGIVMAFGSVSTTEETVKFKLKIKGNAQPGPHVLTFEAKDDSGRTRTASFTLIVQ